MGGWGAKRAQQLSRFTLTSPTKATRSEAAKFLVASCLS